MKRYIVLIVILACAGLIHAQKIIIRQNGATVAFHTDLDDAVTQASNGDTLYIPGGSFPLNVEINKELHFIGEGHHPDSCRVNGISYITTVINLKSGASNSSFEGLCVNGNFTVNDPLISNLVIKRCYVKHITHGITPIPIIKDCIFTENVFMEYINCNVNNSAFNNCIFQHTHYKIWNNCSFRNCIFMYDGSLWSGSWSDPAGANYSNFENNIFLFKRNSIDGVGASVFNNNLFVGSPVLDGVNLKGSNNITGQLQESIFVNQSGNTFLYSHNYQLKATSPGKNKGTDGTDIGIYGGPSPWKDGSLPFNPHVQYKNVAGYTNADGTLTVKVKVAAQER